MRKCAVVLAVALLAVAGCVCSLHPLYTEKDLVFEPSLLGVWDAGDGGYYELRQAGPKEYEVICTDEKVETARLSARLFRLEGRLFADLFPKEDESEDDVFHVPVHMLMKVSAIEPNLKLAILDADWLKQYLKDHPEAVAYEVLQGDGRIVLTGSTAELQKFVLAHVDDEAAWAEFGTLGRVAAPQPEATSPSQEPPAGGDTGGQPPEAPEGN